MDTQLSLLFDKYRHEFIRNNATYYLNPSSKWYVFPFMSNLSFGKNDLFEV